MTTTPRKGRRTSIALGVAAASALAVLAWLGAPFVVDEWWIRKLRSSEKAEVRVAIEKIIERRAIRAGPALLSIIGESKHPMVDPELGVYSQLHPQPIPWIAAGALRTLDRPPEWFARQIEIGTDTQAQAAIRWVGLMRWEEAVPALRRVVERNGSLAPVAALALARILPVLRVEGSTIEDKPDGRSMPRARLRFTNPTGRSLWFRGTSPVRPFVMREVLDPKWGWWFIDPESIPKGSGPMEFPAGSSFVAEELVSMNPSTRFHFYISNSASSVHKEDDGSVYMSWDTVRVESDVLKRKQP